jgi:hypothetical protein
MLQLLCSAGLITPRLATPPFNKSLCQCCGHSPFTHVQGWPMQHQSTTQLQNAS